MSAGSAGRVWAYWRNKSIGSSLRGDRKTAFRHGSIMTRSCSRRVDDALQHADTPTPRHAETFPLPGSHRAAFQPEIALSVLETNSSHQVAKQFFVHRDFATVHFLSKQIAKDPSKIFVSRIRHEASRVR